MKQTKFAVGEPVRVTSGVYAGAEGVIEDLQPECSAVRIHTKQGTVYSLLDHMEPIPKPKPMLASKGNPLQK